MRASSTDETTQAWQCKMSNMFGAVYTVSGPMYDRTPEAVGFPKLVSLPRASLLGGGHCRLVHNKKCILTGRLYAYQPVSAGAGMSWARGGHLMPAVAWLFWDSKKLQRVHAGPAQSAHS